jgi:chemotaxis response regulator CheB
VLPRVTCAASIFAVLTLSAVPALAGSLCRVAVTGADGLNQSTARGSARFLEAASHAFLAFKVLDEGGEGLSTHTAATVRLLDEAIAEYRRALSQSSELAETDRFLKDRQFERLQRKLGITPGTLEHRRWELIAKAARQSKHATRDLIGVCIGGAEQLKYVTTTLKPDMQPAQRRQVAASWYLTLSHGHLVSDAFDASFE